MVVYGAGVLPYHVNDSGETHVLLGKERYEGTWSDFGGRNETRVDDNDPRKTAAREFVEESIGILTYDECFERIRNVRPVLSRTLNGSTYYMFAMRLDPKPDDASAFEVRSAACSSRVQLEKRVISWVKLDVACDMDLRSVFRSTLKEHMSEIKKACLP